jgi:tape measure domain-containing protein
MTQTINMANIRIGMDVEKLKEGGIKARQELNSLARALKAGADPMEEFAKRKELLDRAMATGGVDQKSYDQILKGFRKSTGLDAEEDRRMAEKIRRIKELDKAQKNQLAEMERAVQEKNKLEAKAEKERQALLSKNADAGKQDSMMSDFIKTISVRAIAYAAAFKAIAASKEAVFGSLKAFGEFESSMVKLTVLTGSRSFAKQLYQDMRQLDKESPLSTAAIQRSATTLLGYGVSAKSVMPALRSLSEIAMGNEERFSGLSLAYAQVMANGRLMGQEVIQMVNAGFNPLQQISQDTGLSMIDLKRRMEDGALASNLVTNALKNATKEGGRFYEMNKLLSKTVEGRQAILQNDVQQLKITTGGLIANDYKNLMSITSSAVGGIDSAIGTAKTYVGKLSEVLRSGSDTGNAGNLFRDFDNMIRWIPMFGAVYGALADDSEKTLRLANERLMKEKELDAIMDRQVQMEKERNKEIKKQTEAVQDQINALTKGVIAAEQIKALRAFREKRVSDDQFDAVKLKIELDFLTKRKGVMADINALLNTEAQQRARLREDRINKEGMKPWQADELAMLEKRLKKEQEIAEAIKEQAAAAEQRVMDNIRESDRVFNDLKSPKQKFEEDIAKLKELRDAGQLGGIDQNTFEQAATALARKFLEQTKADLAPTLRKDTREAYTYMQQENARKKRDEEAKKLAKDSIKELQQINQKMGNQVFVGRKR